MCVAVRANFKSVFINLFDHFRIFLNPKSNQKECCTHVIFFQYLHDIRRFVRTPSSIKRNCNLLFFGFYAIDGDSAPWCVAKKHACNIVASTARNNIYPQQQTKTQHKCNQAFFNYQKFHLSLTKNYNLPYAKHHTKNICFYVAYAHYSTFIVERHY